MKAIFLDFDGVIVTRRTNYKHPDEACMSRFIRILKQFPDCVIVVSSTWRLLHDNDYVKALLHKYGVPKDIKIYFTPELIYHSTNANSLVCLAIPFGRGAEINQWMASTDIVIDSFVILDDDVFDLQTHKERHVKTDSGFGLSDSNVMSAIAILGRPIFCHPRRV